MGTIDSKKVPPTAQQLAALKEAERSGSLSHPEVYRAEIEAFQARLPKAPAPAIESSPAEQKFQADLGIIAGIAAETADAQIGELAGATLRALNYLARRK